MDIKRLEIYFPASFFMKNAFSNPKNKNLFDLVVELVELLAFLILFSCLALIISELW